MHQSNPPAIGFAIPRLWRSILPIEKTPPWARTSNLHRIPWMQIASPYPLSIWKYHFEVLPCYLHSLATNNQIFVPQSTSQKNIDRFPPMWLCLRRDLQPLQLQGRWLITVSAPRPTSSSISISAQLSASTNNIMPHPVPNPKARPPSSYTISPSPNEFPPLAFQDPLGFHTVFRLRWPTVPKRNSRTKEKFLFFTFFYFFFTNLFEKFGSV